MRDGPPNARSDPIRGPQPLAWSRWQPDFSDTTPLGLLAPYVGSNDGVCLGDSEFRGKCLQTGPSRLLKKQAF